MNEKIKALMVESGLISESDISGVVWTSNMSVSTAEKFAELIVQECDQLNRNQSFELAGVVADVELGHVGFDSVCLTTVKRVESYLGNASLKEHFGVKE